MVISLSLSLSSLSLPLFPLSLPPSLQNYSEEVLVKQPPSRQSKRAKRKGTGDSSEPEGARSSGGRRGSGRKPIERERVISKSVRGFSEGEVRRQGRDGVEQ